MAGKLGTSFKDSLVGTAGCGRAAALTAALALLVAAGPALAADSAGAPQGAPPPSTRGSANPGSEIAPPDLPSATPILTMADLLPAALAARLAEPQGALHPRLTRKEREAMAAFYALGNYQPLWIKGGSWNAKGTAVIERLKRAEEDGLDAADYPIPALGASVGDLVAAELKLSAAAVAYARDARGARVEPSRLSRLITPKLDLPSADAVLTVLGAAQDPGAALAGFNPPHEGYRALKAKLAEIRAGHGPHARLEADILANMERWRWLPADMGRRHVWVNVPEFKLRLIKDGHLVHEARVIVGKPETPTPLFSDEMDHAIVNPSWYVPPSIFYNEFGGSAAYAASRGYEVRYTRDGGISVRQPPGERNALGFIKFMFPNQHAVYLHDTPNRNLFGADKRAFSHGCVRLDQPFRFGEFVLGSEWNEARLRSLIGKGERTIRLPEPIPVHLTYFTLMVDEKGALRQIADLYGTNNKVRVALGLSRDATVVASAAAEPPAARRAQTVAEAQPQARPQVRRRPVRHVRTVRAPVRLYYPYFWW